MLKCLQFVQTSNLASTFSLWQQPGPFVALNYGTGTWVSRIYLFKNFFPDGMYIKLVPNISCSNFRVYSFLQLLFVALAVLVGTIKTDVRFEAGVS